MFTDKDTKETADNVAESEGKETVGNTSTDKSELPFNPHQSGPKESHVATEGKEIDPAVYVLQPFLAMP